MNYEVHLKRNSFTNKVPNAVASLGSGFVRKQSSLLVANLCVTGLLISTANLLLKLKLYLCVCVCLGLFMFVCLALSPLLVLFHFF